MGQGAQHGRSEQPGNMLHELDLLVIAVNKNELPLRFDDSKRQPRKAGAGPDIEYGLTLEQRPRRERILDMNGDHLVPVTNGGQVRLPVLVQHVIPDLPVLPIEVVFAVGRERGGRG